MREAIRNVHKSLKKTHPRIVRKVTKPFQYKYKKLTLLGIFIVLTYLLFQQPTVYSYLSHLERLSYLGIFIAGALFAYGFTTPLAIGLFLMINPENIWLAVPIGALGGLFADFVLFKFIKDEFTDEFKEIERTKAIKEFTRVVNHSFSKKVKLYLMYIFAGIILASPAPDEFGVALLAGLGRIRTSVFIVLSFFTKAIAIWILLLI